MSEKARRVKTKLVTATEREVSVGEEKDRRSKMVAEKYMSELKPHSCWNPCSIHAMIRARRFSGIVTRLAQLCDIVFSHVERERPDVESWVRVGKLFSSLISFSIS